MIWKWFKFDSLHQRQPCWLPVYTQHNHSRSPGRICKGSDSTIRLTNYWKLESCFYQRRWWSLLLYYSLDDRISCRWLFENWCNFLIIHRTNRAFEPLVVSRSTITFSFDIAWLEVDDAAEVLGVDEGLRLRLVEGWGLAVSFSHSFRDSAISRIQCRGINRLSMANLYVAPVFLFHFRRKDGNFILQSFIVREEASLGYCQWFVFRSAFVPNLLMLLFRTLTSGTTGSLITVVEGEVRTTVLGAVSAS